MGTSRRWVASMSQGSTWRCDVAVRRWAPVAAGAAVLVVGGGAALLARSGPGPAAAGRPGAPAATSTAAPAPRTLEQLRVRPGDTVTASGTVVAAPGKPVRFCAPVADGLVGTTGPERPPECWLAVTLLGADPGRLTDPKTFGGTRWGQAAITGRWSRGTITVTAQGAPVPDPGPDSTLPGRPPCPAPVGGWREGVLDQSGTDTLTAMIARLNPGPHRPTADPDRQTAQTSITVGMIIGRRRYRSDTQRPTTRRTVWASRCASVMPSAVTRSSSADTSGSTGSNATGSSLKPRPDTCGVPLTLPVTESI